MVSHSLILPIITVRLTEVRRKNFGRILKEDLMPYRDELIITTKAGFDMWGRPLRQLGQPQISAGEPGSEPETYGTGLCGYFSITTEWIRRHRLRRQWELWQQLFVRGKALYVGLSNYDGETLEQAAAILKDLKCPFVINQNCYSIFDRTVEKEWIKGYDRQSEKGLITFSPSGTGTVDGPLSQWDPGRQPYSERTEDF